MEEINSIVVSTNHTLSTALMGLERQFENAARSNLCQAIQDEPGYTEMEKLAMTKMEELKLINGMDLAAIMLRGKLIQQIENDTLYSVHPTRYNTMEEAASACGISLTQYSNTRTMYEVVFPYMENVLGVDIARFWEEIGKSNMNELLPMLRALATGQPPEHGSTRENYDNILNDTAATLRIQAEANPDQAEEVTEENLRRHAFNDLLNLGSSGIPVRELRQHIRRTSTQAVEATILTQGDHRYVLAEMDNDQWTAFTRKLGPFIDPQEFDLPADPRERARTAARIAQVRRITRLITEE
jgi:hypothetical protein